MDKLSLSTAQKPNSLAVLSLVLAVVFAAAAFFFFNASQTEKKIQKQKSAELQQKILELNDKESKLAAAIKAKSDLEQDLNDQISSLTMSLDEANKFELKTQALGDEVDTLKIQVEDFQKEINSKKGMIDGLNKKIEQLERDKADLSEKIQHYEAETSRKEAPAAENPNLGVLEKNTQDLLSTDPVKLGKIVVQKDSGDLARVQQVNKVYGFVVINAGSNDGLKQNSVINIVRGKKIIGRAVVEKVRENTAAAMSLPEWTREDIAVGDLVSRF